MSILDNWEQWKDFLGDRLNQARGSRVKWTITISDASLSSW